MFKITAYYQTGNSFGSEDTQEDLGVVLDNKEEALQCLKFAKEHYEFSKTLTETSYNSRPPRKRDTLIEKVSNKEWFSKEYPESYFLFKGKSVSAFYLGYFETLYKLQVHYIDSEYDNMIFEPNNWL